MQIYQTEQYLLNNLYNLLLEILKKDQGKQYTFKL